MQQSWIIVTLGLAWLVSGCTARREVVRDADPTRLTPAEVALLEQPPPAGPLRVLHNDEPLDDRRLRSPSQPLDWQDPHLPRLLERLRTTLTAEQGVGIAAPQVGLLRRVVLVQRMDRPDQPVLAYLDPRIVEQSPEELDGWEGCLSVPAGHARVRRAASIVVEHRGLTDGAVVREEVFGFTARIFQHELDHLDGRLFIDRIGAMPLVPKEEYRRLRATEREAEAAARRFTRPLSLVVYADPTLSQELTRVRRGSAVTVRQGLELGTTPAGRPRTRWSQVVQVELADGRRGWLKPCTVFEMTILGEAAGRDVECLLQPEPPGEPEADYEAVRQTVRDPTLALARLTARRAPSAPAPSSAEAEQAAADYHLTLERFCDAHARLLAVHGAAHGEVWALWLRTMMATRTPEPDRAQVETFLGQAEQDCRVAVGVGQPLHE